MAQSPTPWPGEWKQEYIETIHRVVESHRDALHFDKRLKILREGFAPCWEGLTKSRERALFEVCRCRMRWYVEHLMETEFPSEEERQQLRDQYTDIWNYAADSLLAQFPFLDPNTVQKARQDDLSICYRKIDTPLMPIYLKPMSEEQVAQIKQRWDKLGDFEGQGILRVTLFLQLIKWPIRFTIRSTALRTSLRFAIAD